MKNYYFESIPVSQEEHAMVLASPSTWEIIGKLRESGVHGQTVEELETGLDIPKSTVYHILKALRTAGFVETKRSIKKIGRPSRERDEEEKRTGKQKKIYIEKIPWGSYSFDMNFDRFAVEHLDWIIDESDIFQHYIKLVEKIILTMKKDGKDFLPSDELCSVCNRNHEAEEFIMALIFLISDRVLKNHDFLVNLRDKHNLNIHG